MTDKINDLLRRVAEFSPRTAADVEEFRIRILGKKGELNALMEEFRPSTLLKNPCFKVP